MYVGVNAGPVHVGKRVTGGMFGGIMREAMKQDNANDPAWFKSIVSVATGALVITAVFGAWPIIIAAGVAVSIASLYASIRLRRWHNDRQPPKAPKTKAVRVAKPAKIAKIQPAKITSIKTIQAEATKADRQRAKAQQTDALQQRRWAVQWQQYNAERARNIKMSQRAS